jgi:hypothetical protein
MNLGQLRTALTSRLAIAPTGDARLDSTALNAAINRALQDIVSDQDWPWLLTSSSLTLTSGVAAWPTDAMKFRELVIGGDRARFVQLAEFLDTQADGSDFVWTQQGANVAITPTPTTATTGTLWYIRAEPDLSSDGTSPLLPSAHHQVLLARASYHANVRRRAERDVAADLAEFEAGIKRMRDALVMRTGPRQVKPAGSTRRWATWS